VVSATTYDPYITINTNTDNISVLEPNQSEDALINITTASILPNQHEALISLNIVGDNGYEEEIDVYITINTAILTVTTTTVNDGDNNCLDPGETANVIFDLKNIGLVGATNITATLSSTDPFITINTSPQDIASLAADSHTPLTYNISVDESCDMAHLVELNLNTTADNGLNTDITCYLIVGILIENFETGTLTTFEWTQPGDLEWYAITDEVYEGAYSLHSGNIEDNQMSTLEIDMFVIADSEISFARKVSSENYYDFFEFLIDGVVKLSLSGEMAWDEYTCPVTIGAHTFTWRYRKDGTLSNGSDAAWIDNIIFPAVNNIPPILSCETNDIFKTMNTNQEEFNPLTISNIGGGFVEFEINIIPDGAKNKSIDGTSIEANLNTFEPGMTYDVTFELNAASPDMEWIKTLTIDFPNEITVNSSSDLVGPSGTLYSNALTGESADLIWTTTETWGQIHQDETATCTVNITFNESYTGSTSDIECTVSGDTYGSEPHTVYSTIEITNSNSFWLNVNPMDGVITYDSDFELTLNYNTTDMTEGVYYADLVISDVETIITIPVELTVDLTSDIENVNPEQNPTIYPNPFNTILYLDYSNTNADIISIKLYDITGKLIDIHNSKTNTSSLNKIIEINIGKTLPTGMYLLRIEHNNNCYFEKVIKN
jgi:hypothetical protein